MSVITVAPRSDAERALWRLSLELAGILEGLEWTLAGAHMVMLLEREAGIESGRTTGDVDAVIGGARAVASTREAANRLIAAGFERAVEHPHRYVRDADQVDLLTVDHLRTAEIGVTSIPGGRRALGTVRDVHVRVTDVGQGVLPVPAVAGAIAVKLQAWAARRQRRDLEDLVRLLALVGDVDLVRSALKPGERRALGRLVTLADPLDAAWRATGSPLEARAALARLKD